MLEMNGVNHDYRGIGNLLKKKDKTETNCP